MSADRRVSDVDCKQADVVETCAAYVTYQPDLAIPGVKVVESGAWNVDEHREENRGQNVDLFVPDGFKTFFGYMAAVHGLYGVA